MRRRRRLGRYPQPEPLRSCHRLRLCLPPHARLLLLLLAPPPRALLPRPLRRRPSPPRLLLRLFRPLPSASALGSSCKLRLQLLLYRTWRPLFRLMPSLHGDVVRPLSDWPLPYAPLLLNVPRLLQLP